MIVATVLLSPHFYGYDLTILLLPFLLILSTTNLDRWRNVRSERGIVILVLACFSMSGAFSTIARFTHVQTQHCLIDRAVVTFRRSQNLADRGAFNQAEKVSSD